MVILKRRNREMDNDNERGGECSDNIEGCNEMFRVIYTISGLPCKINDFNN